MSDNSSKGPVRQIGADLNEALGQPAAHEMKEVLKDVGRSIFGTNNPGTAEKSAQNGVDEAEIKRQAALWEIGELRKTQAALDALRRKAEYAEKFKKSEDDKKKVHQYEAIENKVSKEATLKAPQNTAEVKNKIGG